jgi:hypothetical protein
MMERQRKEQRKAERQQLKEQQRRAESQKMDTHYDSDIVEEERALPSSLPSAEAPALVHGQHEPVPKPAHALAHDISHGEPVSTNLSFLKIWFLLTPLKMFEISK